MSNILDPADWAKRSKEIATDADFDARRQQLLKGIRDKNKLNEDELRERQAARVAERTEYNKRISETNEQFERRQNDFLSDVKDRRAHQ